MRCTIGYSSTGNLKGDEAQQVRAFRFDGDE
jgi:hypothetical protein